MCIKAAPIAMPFSATWVALKEVFFALTISKDIFSQDLNLLTL